MATQQEILNLFDLIGAVTNNDFVLMQVSDGTAKKVNTQVLATYLGRLAVGFLTVATDQQIQAIFNLPEPPTAEQGANASVSLGGLYKFLTQVRTMLQNQIDGLATEDDVTQALLNLKEEIGSVKIVALSESTYEALVEQNQVDPDTYYMTYEDDTQG